MYAGQSVEGGPSEEVIQQPKHPYTRLLVSAAPDPDRLAPGDDPHKNDLPARGEIPSLITPPSGCRFHPRCPHAMAICAQQAPPSIEVTSGHVSSCWLHTTDPGSGTPQNPAPIPPSTASQQDSRPRKENT
jgi:peptide/nickel transport system ATP-binding protein